MEKKIEEVRSFSEKIKNLVDLIWEFRILKYIPRAGFHYLKGPVRENVSEHSFFTTILAWLLAKMEGGDEEKTIKMSLIHDLAEARGGERNLINKFYTQTLNEPKIIKEISKKEGVDGLKLEKLFQEFSEEKSMEARIVKDADVLAWLMVEKECLELGNKKAKKWVVVSLKRLKTKKAQELGQALVERDSDEWWLQLVNQYILKTKFF